MPCRVIYDSAVPIYLPNVDVVFVGCGCSWLVDVDVIVLCFALRENSRELCSWGSRQPVGSWLTTDTG